MGVNNMDNVTLGQPGTFADNVKKLRVAEQLSQKDLAFLAGVYQEDVHRIEHEIPLQLETKLKILKTLYAKRLLR
jgi:predicted transcriptional regulator